MRMMIEIGVHEALQRAFLAAHRIREADQRHARRAHVRCLTDARRRDPPPRFGKHILHHRADLIAHQFARQPPLACFGIARARRRPAARDQRHRAQLLDRQQPGAQPVVDIVIVIGNIVGDRGDLRLEARPAREIERESRVGLRQRPARRHHRAVVLGQPLERLPRQIEPIPARIGALDRHQRAQRVSVVIEPARAPFLHRRAERRLQRVFAGMAERRMADVMREAQSLGQILVEPKRARDRPADLRDFQAVGEPDAEMIAIGGEKHLRLVTQAAKRDRMDDPIAIALKRVARASDRPARFGMKPAPARRRVRRPSGTRAHFAGSLVIF